MLLDNQNQFRELYVTALRRGRETNLHPVYQDLHKQWALENKAMLYKLSDDEYLQAFTDFLAKEVDGRIEELVSDLENAEELRKLASRGQLLLASEDGKTFDKIITQKQFGEIEAAAVTILSPTLRSTTTNLQELMDEQSILHIVRKLNGQKFAVQGAKVEDGKVKIELVPRAGKTSVEVDISGDTSQPLVYEFIDAEGRKESVPETQLQEAFGVAAEDENLRSRTLDETVVETTLNELGAHNSAEAMNSILAAKHASEVTNAVNTANAINAAEAINQGLGKGLNAPQLTGLGQVMAAKARMSRQKEEQTNRTERIEERTERYEKQRMEEENAATEKTKTTTAREEKFRQKNRKNLMKSGAAIAGIGGVLASGAVGTTFFTIFF